MVQREWVEKDFYKELGVSSDASDSEIKRVARKLLAETPPRPQPEQRRCRGAVQGRRRGQGRAVWTRPSARNTTRPAGSSPTAVGRRFGGGGGGGNFGGFGGDGSRIQPRRPVRRRPADRWRQHRRPVRRTVRSRRSAAAAQPSAPRQRPGDRDGTVVPRGDQGRGHAAAAHQPGAVHQLPRQRRAPGHQPQGVPELQRRGRHQPQPGCVRLLRAVHRMPGHRLDHRGAVRRVRRQGRDHPDPHHQRADSTGRRGRSAHPARRSGRGRSARCTVG